MGDIIKKQIVSEQNTSEILVAVYPEPNWKQVTPHMLDQRVPVFVLVYRWERELSGNKYLYKFSGARLK